MRGVRLDPERLEVLRALNRVPIAGARVLEIGCGDGRATRRYARSARSVVGIDPDAGQISRAKRLLPARLRQKVRFEVGMAETLRFPDRSFDVVIFSTSL